MRWILGVLAACAVVGGLLAGPVRAEEEEPVAPALPEMTDEGVTPTQEQIMEALGAVGPNHEWLAHAVGSWTVSGRYWMEPGQDPLEMSGRAVFRTVKDGRYVRQDFTGEWMGKPYTGTGFSGYDNMNEQFVSIWIDNVSTWPTVSRGTRDGNVVSLDGHMDTPEGPVQTREVLTQQDDGTMLFEMFMKMGDQEMKMMELTYKRAPSSSGAGAVAGPLRTTPATVVRSRARLGSSPWCPCRPAPASSGPQPPVVRR